MNTVTELGTLLTRMSEGLDYERSIVNRSINGLVRKDITTTRQLLAMSQQEIQGIRNIGDRCSGFILEAVALYRKELAGQEPPATGIRGAVR